jgi:hypothetical protein
MNGVNVSPLNHRWYRYGLSQDDYDSRLGEQGGLCAVCRCAPKFINGIERPLSVDHNHRSGENRGLLCDSCNLILGFAKDSQKHLRRLIVYLQKHDGINFDFVEDNPQTRAARELEWQKSLEAHPGSIQQA